MKAGEMCITDRGGLYSFEPVPLPAGGAEGWEKENGRRRSTLLELNTESVAAAWFTTVREPNNAAA